MKPIIDTILNFTISKKLSVFIIATFLVFAQKLTSEQWIDVALMYIGTQGIIDTFAKLIELRRK
jgi:urocanate hydratase